MHKIRHAIAELAKTEEAAMVPEYGMLVGLIAVLVIAGAVILILGITDFYQAFASLFGAGP